MSDTVNVYQALLQAQRSFGKVVKNATNPAFKTKYADLGAVLDAITGPLNDAGLLLVQRFAVDQGGPVLVTEVIHAASGQSLTSTVPVTCKDPTDPQKMGGAITYYRRYSLLALLGLAPEDDDGNAASKPATAPQPRQVPPYAPELREPTPKPAPPVRASTYSDTTIEARIIAAYQMFEAGERHRAIAAHLQDDWDNLTDAQTVEVDKALAEIERKMDEQRKASAQRQPATA